MEGEAVGNLRARVAAWRHRNPSRSLKIIGVAGASGKTTTARLLGEILQEAGHSVMTLTNRGSFHNGQLISERCDRSADAVQHALTVAKKKEVGYVILEVTDELVATHVLPTLLLTMSVLTNDSPGAQALLNEPVDYTVVPSGFDVAGLSVAPHQAISFGDDISAEAQIAGVKELRRGTEVDMVIDHQTKLSVATYLVGRANAMNVAAAVSAAYVLAADTEAFEEGIARLERIAGNYDYIPTGDRPYDIVVDAATTDSSVGLVTASAGKLKKRRLLIGADATLDNALYPVLKQAADRVAVVGDSPELPGVERVESMRAALDLLMRAAKKDDLILLLGRTFAEADGDDRTQAQRMLEAADE